MNTSGGKVRICGCMKARKQKQQRRRRQQQQQHIPHIMHTQLTVCHRKECFEYMLADQNDG
jgi:hypothetical protein